METLENVCLVHHPREKIRSSIYIGLTAELDTFFKELNEAKTLNRRADVVKNKLGRAA